MNGPGAPERQGLYDPANEHDACGVGFVANIKGKKSHAIVAAGSADPAQPHAPRRGRRRPARRRRRRHPDPDSRPLLPRGAGRRRACSCRRSGQYGVGMVFLPKEPASRLACEYEIERAIKDEGQILLGWRDVPVRRHRPRRVGQENRAGHPAGLHRPRQGRHGHRRARAQALHHPQGRPDTRSRRSSSRTARSSTCRRCRRARSSTRACCSRTRSAPTTRTCRTRASLPRSRSCTSASRPTPSRRGTWRTRSG